LKLWEVFRFEVSYQLHRISAAVYFAGVLGATILMASSFVDDALREGYFFNGPIMISGATVLTTMLALLVTAAVAGDAATRDMQARMEPLLYTSPVRKTAYLGGRFLGAFAVGALLLLAVPAGLLLSPWILRLDPEIVGPFRPGAYLFAYGVFALPNAFICTALLFALAALSRRALAGYLGGAAMFLGAIFNDEYVGQALGKWELAKRLDPVGFIAIKTVKNSWTPLQRSTLAVPLEGSVLTNRLIWLGVALAVLGLAEVPLLRAVDRFEVYRTGPFAMYALRETIGEEKVNAALRTLLDRFRSGEPPYPTSLDLYAQLRAVTPPATHYLLKDLFEEITFWDLRTKAARVKPAADGAYEVTLDLEAYKLKVGTAAREKRVPMSELVDIGIYGPSKDGWTLGEPLYVRKHRIRSGTQSITVTVPRRPASAGIDPNFTLLDRKRDDNMKPVG
jgi:hypothetical protein